jgi:YVTN family beta-propeller protein
MSLTTIKGYHGCVICLWLLLAMPLTAASSRILVGNYVSRTIDVIDPVTNKIVQTYNTELSYMAKGSPDGSRIYTSDEDEMTLDVLDRKTGKIIKKVPLSGYPNYFEVTKDGGRAVISLRNLPGAVDIVDLTSLKLKKTIPVRGGLHALDLTRDGKYALAGSIWSSRLSVIDLQTETLAWEVQFDLGVRPITSDTNPDGSTRRVYLNLTDFHGFAVVDFATHAEVARIMLPDEPNWYEAGGRPRNRGSHGIAVAPDNKTLWVNSASQRCVFVYSLPDLKLLGHARTGGGADWLTFSPDGKWAYVSNGWDNTVSAIDTKTIKEVTRIPTHGDPARMSAWILP